MTIRGGGNPHSAMAAMPLREWTRRLGALPAEAYDCFMVWTPYGFNRIQAWFARLIAANGRLPSDRRAAARRRWKYAEMGLGCVKTRRRAAVIEQTFGRQPLGYASVPKEARSQQV